MPLKRRRSGILRYPDAIVRHEGRPLQIEDYERRLEETQLLIEDQPLRTDYSLDGGIDHIIQQMACGRVLCRKQGEEEFWQQAVCEKPSSCRCCRRRWVNWRAADFAERLLCLHNEIQCWSIVFNFPIPSIEEQMEDMFGRACSIVASMSDVAQRFRDKQTGADRSKPLHGYIAGVHTKPLENNLLWPHVHVLLFGDQRKSPAAQFCEIFDQALEDGIDRAETKDMQAFGLTQRSRKNLHDLKKLVRYCTRTSDRDDSFGSICVRERLLQKWPEAKLRVYSRLPSLPGRRKRMSWPNRHSFPADAEYQVAYFQSDSVDFMPVDRQEARQFQHEFARKARSYLMQHHPEAGLSSFVDLYAD